MAQVLRAEVAEMRHHWDRVCRTMLSPRGAGPESHYFVEHHADLLRLKVGDVLDIEICAKESAGSARGTPDYAMAGQVAQVRESDVVISCGGLLLRMPRHMVSRDREVAVYITRSRGPRSSRNREPRKRSAAAAGLAAGSAR